MQLMESTLPSSKAPASMHHSKPNYTGRRASGLSFSIAMRALRAASVQEKPMLDFLRKHGENRHVILGSEKKLGGLFGR